MQEDDEIPILHREGLLLMLVASAFFALGTVAAFFCKRFDPYFNTPYPASSVFSALFFTASIIVGLWAIQRFMVASDGGNIFVLGGQFFLGITLGILPSMTHGFGLIGLMFYVTFCFYRSKKVGYSFIFGCLLGLILPSLFRTY